MKILALTRYDSLGASSRLRSMQYFPELEGMGCDVSHSPLIDNDSLDIKYTRGSYPFLVAVLRYFKRFMLVFTLHRYDIIWIEKEAFPWLPFWIEKIFLSFSTKYVLDFDDAVFHRYDQSERQFVRYIFSDKLDRLMRDSSLTICGNDYLASRAQLAGCANVAIVPTVVDCDRYQLRDRSMISNGDLQRVVWIGSPSTVGYLHSISTALVKASKRKPFVLRVIGANFEHSQLLVESFRWSEKDEGKLISESDVGIMPLLDSSWERGKCGYKLIQYMAVGLPVLASPVGANCQIVTPGINGYLPSTEEEWVEDLVKLLTDYQSCNDLGAKGHARVKSAYSLKVMAPRLYQLLISA
jgi:glycosyltransferase involved in cell wall biosynthesis